jgi:hypothetical protein
LLLRFLRSVLLRALLLFGSGAGFVRLPLGQGRHDDSEEEEKGTCVEKSGSFHEASLRDLGSTGPGPGRQA